MQVVDLLCSFINRACQQPGHQLAGRHWTDGCRQRAVCAKRDDGTIITKDYPDDAQSELDLPGRFRVNVHVGRDRPHVPSRAAN
jgi:hypothetical protein